MIYLFILVLTFIIFIVFFESVRVDYNACSVDVYLLKKILLILALVFFIFFGGSRNIGFGFDDLNYATYFLDYINYDYLGVNLEPGFKFLIVLVSYITNDVHIYFSIIIAISLGLTLAVINRYPYIISLSILIIISHTYWARELNQLRAAISYSMALYFLCGYYSRNRINNVLLLLISILFHVTSVFILIPIILNKFNIKFKMAFVLVLLSIVLGFVFTNIIDYVLSYLPLNAFFLEKVSKYLTDNSVLVYSLSVFNPVSLKYLFFFLFFSYSLNKSKMMNCKQVKLLYLSYLCSVCWIFIFRDYAVFAARIASLFSYVEIILVPMSIYLIRNNSLKFTSLFFIVGLYIVILYINITYSIPFFEYKFLGN